MNPRRTKKKLVLRVYALTAGLAIAIMVALLVLPRYTRGARHLEPQAALVQFLVDQVVAQEPAGVRRVAPPDRAAAARQALRSTPTATGACCDRTIPRRSIHRRPTSTRSSPKTKWALSYGRIVVRSDDASMIGVYEPNRPGFPWDFVLPLGAGVLAVVGAAPRSGSRAASRVRSTSSRPPPASSARATWPRARTSRPTTRSAMSARHSI